MMRILYIFESLVSIPHIHSAGALHDPSDTCTYKRTKRCIHATQMNAVADITQAQPSMVGTPETEGCDR